MTLRPAMTLIAATVLVAGCSMSMPKMPRVHKVTVQQGNVITQEMIDRLKPGMTPVQVAFIMGEPVFRNTFNRDRWDYVYTLEVPGIYGDEKRISLHFEDDKLAYFTGDYTPSAEEPEDSGTEGTAEDAGEEGEETTAEVAAEAVDETVAGVPEETADEVTAETQTEEAAAQTTDEPTEKATVEG